MITLYGMGSPNVVKVLLALEEMGLGYDFVHVDVISGDQFEEGFGALTPNRKVPVLVDDEGPRAADGGSFKLWESGAILLYLADRSGSFLPADAAGRYAVYQWLMFQMASIGPMGGQHAHFLHYAPGGEHAYARARYTTEVKRIHDVVDARLQESAYLAGDSYTIADMAAWPWLRGAYRRGLDLDVLPGIRRWVDEIAARPAAERALAAIGNLDTSKTMQVLKEGGSQLDRYLGRGEWSRADPA